MAHASLTPALAAMMDRVGAAVPFAKGRNLLAELAGIELSTKRVERSAEADGKSAAVAIDAAAVATGEVVPLSLATPVAKLYVARRRHRDTRGACRTAGRDGKDPDGRNRGRHAGPARRAVRLQPRRLRARCCTGPFGEACSGGPLRETCTNCQIRPNRRHQYLRISLGFR